MKGKWKVSYNPVGGIRLYQAYRIRDTSSIDHSGNREYSGGWTENREEAQTVADNLNKKGGNQ